MRNHADLIGEGTFFDRFASDSNKTNVLKNFLQAIYEKDEFKFIKYINAIIRVDFNISYEFIRDPMVLGCFRKLELDFNTEGDLIKTSIIYKEVDDEILGELDSLLSNIDKKYPKKRKTSREALYSGNFDNLVQGATSMRELFNRVLRKLVPDSVFAERPTRKLIIINLKIKK